MTMLLYESNLLLSSARDLEKSILLSLSFTPILQATFLSVRSTLIGQFPFVSVSENQASRLL